MYEYHYESQVQSTDEMVTKELNALAESGWELVATAASGADGPEGFESPAMLHTWWRRPKADDRTRAPRRGARASV